MQRLLEFESSEVYVELCKLVGPDATKQEFTQICQKIKDIRCVKEIDVLHWDDAEYRLLFTTWVNLGLREKLSKLLGHKERSFHIDTTYGTQEAGLNFFKECSERKEKNPARRFIVHGIIPPSAEQQDSAAAARSSTASTTTSIAPAPAGFAPLAARFSVLKQNAPEECVSEKAICPPEDLFQAIHAITDKDKPFFEKFSNAIDAESYGKALRIACNTAPTKGHAEEILQLIKILLSYKNLHINVNEKVSGKSACDYASTINPKAYELLKQYESAQSAAPEGATTIPSSSAPT
jgi:hypothetical protein